MATVRSMTTTYAYLVALGEARSCLAALADSTDNLDLSIHYDHLLIELDGITGGFGPTCSRMVSAQADFLNRLESAVNAMLSFDAAEGPTVEILPASARTGPHG